MSVIRGGGVKHRLIQKKVHEDVFIIDNKQTINASSLEEAVNALAREIAQQANIRMTPLSPPSAAQANTKKTGRFSYNHLIPVASEDPKYVHHGIDRAVRPLCLLLLLCSRASGGRATPCCPFRAHWPVPCPSIHVRLIGVCVAFLTRL
jgi:hypothetical protein